MQNPANIITQAVRGIGEQLAEIYGVSVARMYQILEADYYGKFRRLLRAIAAIDKERVRLIKADLDALFAELLGAGANKRPCVARMHGELSEAIQSILRDLPPAEQMRECLEARLELDNQIAYLDGVMKQKEEIRRDNGLYRAA